MGVASAFVLTSGGAHSIRRPLTNLHAKLTDDGIQVLSTTCVTATGGILYRCKHASSSTKTDMVFSIFLPSSYSIGASMSPTPAIYWLSGLTCTDENFCQKAGGSAFARADSEGVAMIIPDTSPRGGDVPKELKFS